jgi:hypothetical protein
MARVLVLYCSTYGHVETMADAGTGTASGVARIQLCLPGGFLSGLAQQAPPP